MEKGTVWAPEWKQVEDVTTGVFVTQLTDYRGHSHHLYFTNNGWYDNGNKLVIGSDRNNRSDLFSVDIRNGEITQLTKSEKGVQTLSVALNPVRDEAYYWEGNNLIALDLNTLNERVLHERPAQFSSSIINVTADGQYVCTNQVEQLPAHVKYDRAKAYGHMLAHFEYKPLSQVICVPTAGGPAKVVHESHVLMGHVNTSPTQPNLLTFCHEGPWDLVENRVWGLNIETGEAWKIRPRTVEGERVGHEWWLADGLHVGYHGTRKNGDYFFGKIHYDNTGNEELIGPYHAQHYHCNDFSLVVADGSRDTTLRLFKNNGNGFDAPRALTKHRGSFHVQKLHVHPRFDPTGKRIVFSTDNTGYGNVYVVEVPEFESLPELAPEIEGVEARFVRR